MPSFCYLARNRATIYAMIRLSATAEHQAIKKFFIFSKIFQKGIDKRYYICYYMYVIKR